MGLRLLHQEERKVRIADLLQLDRDRGHEQEVGIAVTGIPEIFRADTMVGEFEA